jgi:hypothetical protein
MGEIIAQDNTKQTRQSVTAVVTKCRKNILANSNDDNPQLIRIRRVGEVGIHRSLPNHFRRFPPRLSSTSSLTAARRRILPPRSRRQPLSGRIKADSRTNTMTRRRVISRNMFVCFMFPISISFPWLRLAPRSGFALRIGGRSLGILPRSSTLSRSSNALRVDAEESTRGNGQNRNRRKTKSSTSF